MAFPASTQRLDAALTNACAQALRVKQFFTQLRNDSAAGDVTRDRIIIGLQVLTGAITTWDQARSTPGIAAYAQAQLGTPELDVNTEFTAMMSTADLLRTWIATNFPKDAGGAWLVYSYDATGAQSPLVFTTAQLNQFRTNVDALLAKIA